MRSNRLDVIDNVMSEGVPLQNRRKRSSVCCSPRYCWAALLCFAVLGLPTLSFAQQPQTADAVYEVRGRVEGLNRRPGKSVIFVCDASTGMPIPGPRPAKSDQDKGWEWVLHTIADDQGNFTVGGLKAGKYRFIAQAWSGVEGLPLFQRDTPTTVILHGTAENVAIPDPTMPGNAENVVIKPLGHGTVRLTADPEESGAFMFLSRGRTIGDPILSIAGWGTDFIKGVFAFTHVSSPTMTLVGLPDKTEVTASVFYYDNVPGIGGATWTTGLLDEVAYRVMAGWSNGHDRPPAHLAPLTDYLREHPEIGRAATQEATEKLRAGFQGGRFQSVWDDLGGPDREIEVPGFGTAALADLLAAYNYAELQRHHAAMKARRANLNQNPPTQAP